MRKRKQREQSATGLKLEEQYPAPPPRSRNTQIQGTNNSAKSTPECSKLNKSDDVENAAPYKVIKKDSGTDNTPSKGPGAMHRTMSDNKLQVIYQCCINRVR